MGRAGLSRCRLGGQPRIRFLTGLACDEKARAGFQLWAVALLSAPLATLLPPATLRKPNSAAQSWHSQTITFGASAQKKAVTLLATFIAAVLPSRWIIWT